MTGRQKKGDTIKDERSKREVLQNQFFWEKRRGREGEEVAGNSVFPRNLLLRKEDESAQHKSRNRGGDNGSNLEVAMGVTWR